MSTATKRARRAIKETLRVADRIVEYPSHFESLMATGRTECRSYDEARQVKSEADSPLTYKRGIIIPLANGGWEVKQVTDDPRESMGRSSEVLDLVIQAEELGKSVEELMGYNPGRTMRSSGNAGQRVSHANAVAEAGHRQSQAHAWAESVWIKGKGWSE